MEGHLLVGDQMVTLHLHHPSVFLATFVPILIPVGDCFRQVRLYRLIRCSGLNPFSVLSAVSLLVASGTPCLTASPPPHLARSPSPEPIYSHDGKRLNTREVRVRKKLEDERHDLIQKAVKSNPGYKPPADYK